MPVNLFSRSGGDGSEVARDWKEGRNHEAGLKEMAWQGIPDRGRNTGRCCQCRTECFTIDASEIDQLAVKQCISRMGSLEGV